MPGVDNLQRWGGVFHLLLVHPPLCRANMGRTAQWKVVNVDCKASAYTII